MNPSPTPTDQRSGHNAADAAPFARARSLPRHRARRPRRSLAVDTLTPQNAHLDVEAALRQH